mmetsp:Transcript_11940/g.55418  ORF Transcript_11940/g.55418 Transcript_11940/m.55418 type:complete len:311 (+) Transcript_11940:262-1194(+)
MMSPPARERTSARRSIARALRRRYPSADTAPSSPPRGRTPDASPETTSKRAPLWERRDCSPCSRRNLSGRFRGEVFTFWKATRPAPETHASEIVPAGVITQPPNVIIHRLLHRRQPRGVLQVRWIVKRSSQKLGLTPLVLHESLAHDAGTRDALGKRGRREQPLPQVEHPAADLVRDDPERGRRACAGDETLVRVRGFRSERRFSIGMTHRDHHLHRESPRDGRQPRARHRALLVQRAVAGGVRRRGDVVAEVATKPTGERAARIVLCIFLRRVFFTFVEAPAVPHHEVRVEAERGVDEQLTFRGAHQRG